MDIGARIGKGLLKLTSHAPEASFKVVYSSINAWEAELVRHALELEGIESFIDNDYIVNANWLYSNAVGGVRLRVYSLDAGRAEGIIRAMQKRAYGPLGHESNGTGEDRPRHPHAKGKRKRIITWSGLAAVISWLLLGIPLFFRRRRNRGPQSFEDEPEDARTIREK